MALRFLRIARLIVGNKIVNPEAGTPTTAFMRQINDTFANIESAVNSIKQQQDDIQFSLQQAGIAITNAAEAHTLAVAQGRETDLVTSFVSPAVVLTASVDPTDDTKAIVTVADHTRIYGSGVSVSVTGATITGLALATKYYVTYLDAARAGGTTTFTTTTNYLDAGQGLDRHLIGDIYTPETASDPPVEGGGVRPPGTGYCVVTSSLILMANENHDGPGDEKLAGDIRVGDWVWTQHELSMGWGAYPVEAIRLVKRHDVMALWGYPDATPEHPFWNGTAWETMQALVASTKMIKSKPQTATVAHLTIADAHTFIARHPRSPRGILSHNKSAENPLE